MRARPTTMFPRMRVTSTSFSFYYTMRYDIVAAISGERSNPFAFYSGNSSWKSFLHQNANMVSFDMASSYIHSWFFSISDCTVRSPRAILRQ